MIRYNLIFSIMIISLLVACQQNVQAPGTDLSVGNAYPIKGTTDVVVSTSVATNEKQLSNSPATSSVVTQVGYPGPVVAIQTIQPYPDPAGGSQSAASLTPSLNADTSLYTKTPVTSTSLPNGQPGDTPYPGPMIVNTLSPTFSTNIEEVTLTLTPTANSLPFPMRTELLASDPSDFKLVSGSIQLVEFFAFWSPASKSMAPILYALEDDYGDLIHFVYLDIDDPKNGMFKFLLADRLPPLFFLLDENGNLIQTWQGYTPRENFEPIFRTLLP